MMFVHCTSASAQNNFSFAFFTDIHYNGSNQHTSRLMKMLSKAEDLNCDFIITGGDNVEAETCIKTHDTTFVQLYILDSIFKNTNTKIFPIVGNHDRYLCSPEDSKYNTGLFTARTGFPDHYSFDYKGWHFIMLNNVCFDKNPGRYSISDEQLSWLRQDLTSTSAITPVFLIVHVPLVSIIKPFIRNKNRERKIRKPFREMMTLFEGHNLRMVLQGHHHIYKISCLNEIPFITGGAIHPAPWSFLFNTKPGFVYLSIQQETITYQYITENE